MEEKDKKKRLKRRSIDSKWTREKWSFNFLEISEETTDSAEIIPVIIKDKSLRWGLERKKIFLKNLEKLLEIFFWL